MTLPTKEQLEAILLEAERLLPRASKGSRYSIATAATLDGSTNAPLILDHLIDSDMLVSVRLRKRCNCARCDEVIFAATPAYRLMTFSMCRSDRFCLGCRSVMIMLGSMPGSDSMRRVARFLGARGAK